MILYKVRVSLANTMFYGVLRAFTYSVSATLKYNVNVALCRKDGLRKCIGLPFLTSSCYYGKCSTSYFQYIAKNMFLLIYVKTVFIQINFISHEDKSSGVNIPESHTSVRVINYFYWSLALKYIS